MNTNIIKKMILIQQILSVLLLEGKSLRALVKVSEKITMNLKFYHIDCMNDDVISLTHPANACTV